MKFVCVFVSCILFSIYMSKFIIEGRHKLEGEVEIFGAKNEATKLVAAACLTDQDVVINNAPRILDFERMMEVVRSMGGRAEWTGDHQATINCRDIDPAEIDQKLVRQFRACVVFIGPLLSRFKKIDFPVPGGCVIGNRPLDVHFIAFGKMGAKVEYDSRDNLYHLAAEQLNGKHIVLSEFSVTATENIIMAAVLAKGKTTLKIAAAEPHVEDLCHCLNKMGAKIKGAGTHTLEIEGVEKLTGIEHAVIPDTIDAGTFICLAAATKSHLTIKNIEPHHMDLFLERIKDMGIRLKIGQDFVQVEPSGVLRALNKIETNIYPGVPTDLHQPIAVLATQCDGTTMIFEKMYEGRFNYVSDLNKMGANIIIADPHRIIINGPTPLYGQEVKSYDLRAGATLIIAGLLADGETIIHEAEMAERGYEDIIGRLTKIGAKIEKVD